MRNYQAHKNNPYYLPRSLYRRVVALIQDYDRMIEERADIVWGTPDTESGMPRGSGPGNPTADKALRLERIEGDLEAIDQALIRIPADYRVAVRRLVQLGGPYPPGADGRTYRRWKQILIYHTAKNLHLI